MPDKHYYVSVYTGDDNNDGLSPDRAFKTLAKAATKIVPSNDGNTYVWIAPGIYRESFVSPSGISKDKKIIWAGDPGSHKFPGLLPGKVRITKADSEGNFGTGAVLDWTPSNNVELWNVEVDGTYNGYCCSNIEVCKNVNVCGYNGFYNSLDKTMKLINCKAITSNIAAHCTSGRFYLTKCIFLSVTVVLGGSSTAKQSAAHDCIFVGYSLRGSSTTYSLNNCLVLCALNPSFNNLFERLNINLYPSLANTRLMLVDSIIGNPSATYDININWKSLDYLSYLLENVPAALPGGLIYLYFVGNGSQISTNVLSYNLVQFSTLLAVENAKAYGIAFWAQTIKPTGYIKFSFYENNVLLDEVIVDVSNLVVGGNYIPFNIQDGIDITSSKTYVLKVQGDAASSGSLISDYFVIGLTEDTMKDINGHKRSMLYHTYGVNNSSKYEYKYDEFFLSSPSVKIIGLGEKGYTLQVCKGECVKVCFYLKHNNGANLEPYIRVSGDCLIDEIISYHTAGANIWQKVCVEFTPLEDGTVGVYIGNRDINGWVLASDPIVE